MSEQPQSEQPQSEGAPLPPVPMWPIWVGMACAVAGLVVFTLYPNNWAFWLGLPLSAAPLGIAWWWRCDRAVKLGYGRPSLNDAPEYGAAWGPPA